MSGLTYFNSDNLINAHIISPKKPIFTLNKIYEIMANHKTWHEEHHETLSFGNHLADSVAKGMGSWRFIIAQSILVVLWMGLNIVGFMYHWDVYPFILLNLLFSTQAAYAAPIIMMAQNRQNDRDRVQALADYKTNKEAKLEIEALAIMLKTIEVDKLDKLITMLEELKNKPVK
jgi:uncharacterized membrane protein